MGKRSPILFRRMRALSIFPKYDRFWSVGECDRVYFPQRAIAYSDVSGCDRTS